LIENTAAAIVIKAQLFNPSVFNETWLSKNGIVEPDELDGARVFSKEVAQFCTKRCQVVVLPPQMQITFGLQENDVCGERPSAIACRIVEVLPHTPYQAMGINFDYFVSPPEGEEFHVYERRLLGEGSYALLDEFTCKDARFGRYMSKDHGNGRLKLDVKPTTVNLPGKETLELLRFGFNFHYDLSQAEPTERAAKLLKSIGQWEALREYSMKLVETGT